MARTKQAGDLVQLRLAIGRRLARLAADRHGSRGGAAMARELGVCPRTWTGWACGCAMPGEILLRVIDLTGCEPLWLLDGRAPVYRVGPVDDEDLASLGRAAEAFLQSRSERRILETRSQAATCIRS